VYLHTRVDDEPITLIHDGQTMERQKREGDT
jgi:hypothetical protein